LGYVSPAPSSEIGIAPERLAEWLAEDSELQVVDVREPYEREAGHIAGTRHIELTKRRRALDDGRAGAARGRLRGLLDGRRPHALGGGAAATRA
jgi:rhodanese-related sulfurtransferase